jgi:predicted NBD/HSP70 family sugar kinase
MKRLVAVCLLIFAMSFSTFAGHTVPGDAYCDCHTVGCIEDYAGECSGKRLVATQSNESPRDASAELGIVIIALMLWLRLRA